MGNPMDIMEGLVIIFFLVIVAIFGFFILSHYLAQKKRLSAEMMQALDVSAADYGIKNVTLVGNRGIPAKELNGKIRIIPDFTQSVPRTTIVRYETGRWPFRKVRYIKLLREEHSDITKGEPLYVASTSFLPLGNTGFEVTPNYPMGLAVSDHKDQTLPFAMRQTADAYGQIANKLIEINLTHQEAMERGGGLVKIMGNVKDTVAGAIPRPPKQPR